MIIKTFEIVSGELVKYNGEGGIVTIPDSVKSIGDYAFEHSSVDIQQTKDGNLPRYYVEEAKNYQGDTVYYIRDARLDGLRITTDTDKATAERNCAKWNDEEAIGENSEDIEASRSTFMLYDGKKDTSLFSDREGKKQ